MSRTTHHEVNLFMKAIEKRIKGLRKRLDPKGKYAKVGVPSDSGNAKERDSRGVVKETNTPLVLVGAVHEFGIGVPMRSFLRVPIKEGKREITAVSKLGAIEVTQGKGTIKNTLVAMGEVGVSLSVKSFKINNWEPLKDPTRGGSNPEGDASPLIDTGTLRRSITYEISE